MRSLQRLFGGRGGNLLRSDFEEVIPTGNVGARETKAGATMSDSKLCGVDTGSGDRQGDAGISRRSIRLS